MSLEKALIHEAKKREVRSAGVVVPDSSRCVQCGICSYNCPIGIDVRSHVWKRASVKDSHCLTCGECVSRCPRGVLSFQRSNIFTQVEP